jgi:hypothetical protein
MTYGAGFQYVILVVSARPTNKRPRDLAHVRFGSEPLHIRFTPLSGRMVRQVSASALGQKPTCEDQALAWTAIFIEYARRLR